MDVPTEAPRSEAAAVDPYQPPREGAGAAAFEAPGDRATLGSILATFPLALRRTWSAAAGPYALLSLATLVFVSGPAVALQAMQRGLVEAPISTGGSLALSGLVLLVSLLALAMSLVIGTLGTGLLRAIRIEMLEGPGAARAKGGAFRLALGRFWPVLASSLLVGAGLVAGSLFCGLPVLAAVFFLFTASYWTAACGAGPWEGVVRSVKVALRNVGTFVGLTAIATFAALVYYGAIMVSSLALTARFGMVTGQIVSQVALQVVGLPLGFLAFAFYVAAAVRVETAESGQPLAR